jgi:hypothetical protein
MEEELNGEDYYLKIIEDKKIENNRNTINNKIKEIQSNKLRKIRKLLFLESDKTLDKIAEEIKDDEYMRKLIREKRKRVTKYDDPQHKYMDIEEELRIGLDY